MTEFAKIQVRIQPRKFQFFKLVTMSINNHKMSSINLTSKTLNKAIFKKIKILQKKYFKSLSSLKFVQQTSLKFSLHKSAPKRSDIISQFQNNFTLLKSTAR